MSDELYRDMILELYRNPLNKGVLPDYDAKYQDFSTSCGDDVTVYMKWGSDGRIEFISHDGIGCAISQAAVSLVTDAVKGKTKEEILAMKDTDAITLLGIPISHTRHACATLGLFTLQKAVQSVKDSAEI